MDIKEKYQPLISIIVAVYNGEKHILQTLDSIISQDYENKELIIIDGGSTDRTREILNNYKNYFSYFISEPDRGIYDAWNKGLAASKGDWISFIGSDDVLFKNALKDYVEHIQSHKLYQFEFVSSKIQFVTEDLKPRTLFGRAWSWNSHKVEMRVAHVGALHNKLLFKKYGTFDNNYKIAGDYELLLRPKHELKASYMDKVTVLMRQAGLSSTNTVVFKESCNAKINTGKRNKLICLFEYRYLLFKFYLLKILRA